MNPLSRFVRGLAAVLLAAVCAPVGAQQPVRGGTLTMVVQPEPPILVSATNSAGPIGVVSTKILEGLLSYDFDMNPRPVLAQTWKVSPDGKTITFNLRKGVKWHDGRDFTAADVQFSAMKVWKELHPRGRATFAKLTAVETPSSHVAVFRLSEASPYVMSALTSYESQVLPKHLYEGTDIAQSAWNSKPVGTGPFVFREWQKGSHILLERNPQYWDAGKPFLDKLVLRVIPDAASRAAAFETGEVQLGGFSPVPLSDVRRLEAGGRFDIETRGYEYLAPMFLLEFNTRHKALQDKRVRRAIAHAIDANLVVKTIWFGFGKPATGPVPSVLTQFYNAAVPKYAFDPKRAEALLDEAGFKRGSGRQALQGGPRLPALRIGLPAHGRVREAGARQGRHRRRDPQPGHGGVPEARLHRQRVRSHEQLLLRAARPDDRRAAHLLVEEHQERRAVLERVGLLEPRDGPRDRGRAGRARPEEAPRADRPHAGDRPGRSPGARSLRGALLHARQQACPGPHRLGRRRVRIVRERLAEEVIRAWSAGERPCPCGGGGRPCCSIACPPLLPASGSSP
jgi:hypothetical protein